MTGHFDVSEVSPNSRQDEVAGLAASIVESLRDLADRVAALEARIRLHKPVADCTEAELRQFVDAEFARPPAEPI